MNCVYCPSAEGSTGDHIPPRCFYDDPPPPNLIKVPCCEKCRVRDQKDDRLIRNLFISILQVEPHRAVLKQLGAKRDKSFEEDKAMATRMAKMMVPIAVKDAKGRIVRIAPGFNLDKPVVANFLERVCRGVIYEDHGKAYFPAKFSWVQQPNMPLSLMERAEPSIKQRALSDIFHYFITQTEEGDWFVMLTFFQTLQMLGKLTVPK